MNRGRLTIVAVLMILLAFASGCTDDEAAPASTSLSGPTAISAVTAGPDLPERLQAVTGLSMTPADDAVVWAVTSAGVSTQVIPFNSVASAGRVGATIALWDEDTGDIHLWHPRDSSKAGSVFTIDMPGTGPSPGARIVLSPDETLLAITRLEVQQDGSQGIERVVTRGNLVDLAFEEVSEWEWLDSVGDGYQVTQLHWNKISTAVYVSLGREGNTHGEVSYRYDAWTEEAVELPDIAAVLDIGYTDQIVGFGMPASSDGRDPGSTAAGDSPLVAWRDGVSTSLPGHPGLASRDAAWISDNGHTIVVQGTMVDGDGASPCLEVLRQGVDGWELGHLLVGGEALAIVQGVGFEPNSSIFCFQAGLPPGAFEGVDSGAYLCELETYLGNVISPVLTLPGGADHRIRVLGVVVAEGCGAG